DGVVLDDMLPAAFSAGSPAADLSADCSGSSGNTIHCSLPASLGVGASWTLSLPYAVASDVAAGDVTNTASVVSDENPLGLSASDTTTVLTSANLGLSVDDGLASVIAGTGGHAYTLTVTNAGPSDAGGVSLT